MIYVQGNIANFEGTAKELTFELTHLLLGFKYNLMKEFNLTESEVFDIISKCGEIAFMSTEERNNLLMELEDLNT